MWETQRTNPPVDCIPTMPQLVAHEIGHVLGLADADAYSQCDGTIMGKSPSFVSSDQCAAVQDTWYTPAEQQQDRQTALEECESHCNAFHCEETLSGSFYCPGNGESPIIIDFN